MKKLQMLLALVLTLTLLAACGSEDPAPSTGGGDEPAATTAKATEAATEKATEAMEPSGDPLQMLWWSDGIEGEVMQGIIDDFTAETGIEIELVVLGWDDYASKLKTMIRGGQAPALIRATEGTVYEFMDFLVPLQDAYDATEFTNVYYNDAGQPVILPMDVTSNGLYVNTDLADKYGVNYPSLGESWTWAEFETEMAKLSGDDVAFPGVFDNKAHRYFPMFYQFGGTIWEEPYNVSGLTSDASVEALTTLQRMNTNGTLDPAVWAGSAKPNELFQTGKYGFHMSGNWFVAAYQDLSFNWSVVPMPVGNGADATRSTILGGKGLCAVAESGQEAEALQFIEFMAAGENHDKFSGGVPFLSPRLAATPDYGVFQAAYEVFQDEISNTPVANVQDWQYQVAIAGMYPIINGAVEDAMGGKDVMEVLKELEEDLMEKAEETGLK
jgi:alpha-1,4-digalacturonate transport system substrate-binding protein